MLRQAIQLELRKQTGSFLSLLLLIVLSFVTVIGVTAVSSGYDFAHTLQIAWMFMLIAGSFLLPAYLGSYWGAALRRDPIASIEEVLPISARIRKTAALLVSVAQLILIIILAVFASAFIQGIFDPLGWILTSVSLLWNLSIVFLCSYRTKNPWSGIAVGILCVILSWMPLMLLSWILGMLF